MKIFFELLLRLLRSSFLLWPPVRQGRLLLQIPVLGRTWSSFTKGKKSQFVAEDNRQEEVEEEDDG